jgi:anti-anti-sigma factor
VSATTDATGTTHIALVGELDAAVAEELLDTLYDLVDETISGVSVDLGGVTFLDCAVLGTLVAVRARAEARGRSMRVHSAAGQALVVLKLSGTFDWLCNGAPVSGSARRHQLQQAPRRPVRDERPDVLA